jgi:hypothetical protein
MSVVWDSIATRTNHSIARAAESWMRAQERFAEYAENRPINRT